MNKEEIALLIESDVRKVMEDEPEPEVCGCEESSHYINILVRLRAEFDYLFERRDAVEVDFTTLLVVCIENRLAEARMAPKMFGTDGIAGLPAPYRSED